MYKIFINNTPLYLMETHAVSTEWKNQPKSIVMPYIDRKSLFWYIDKLEKNAEMNYILLHSNDLEKLWADFKSIYKIIQAAGGVVENVDGKTLLIFRRNFWDLPKGKIDKGETKEHAAVREVQEETGIQQIELLNPVRTTYHTYPQKEKRILKETFWFKMKTQETDLLPQAEEDIEQAIWVDLKTFLTPELPIYKNILEVLFENDK
jgi:8-oxo-dGTP pyrophosphatase MutT (NUDIX family)